jgi:hypothetical protein
MFKYNSFLLTTITSFLLIQIAVAWKPIVKRLGLWKTVRSLGRLYDAGMGMIIFVPIAICSWFPFISTFQTRLLFNQAFSRGLEISLILAGQNQNTGAWWQPYRTFESSARSCSSVARSILGSQFSCKCVYLDVERQLSAMVVACRWWCTLRTGYWFIVKRTRPVFMLI